MKKQNISNKALNKKSDNGKPGIDLGNRLANYQVNQLNTASDNKNELNAKNSRKALQQKRRNRRFSRVKRNSLSLCLPFSERFLQQMQLLSGGSVQS